MQIHMHINSWQMLGVRVADTDLKAGSSPLGAPLGALQGTWETQLPPIWHCAVHAQELTRQDWEALLSWLSVKPTERRRVLQLVPPSRF